MDNIKFASPDEICFTDDKNNIICTNALATCIGMLIYDEKNKKAALGHFYSNKFGSKVTEEANDIFASLIKSLDMNDMLNENLKYMIVPGGHAYYYNIDKIYKVCDELFEKFEKIPNFKKFTKEEIKEDTIKENIETKSLELAFDALNGKFVTNELFKEDMDFDHYEFLEDTDSKTL